MRCEICSGNGTIELSCVRPDTHRAIRGVARCNCIAGGSYKKFASIEEVIRRWLSYQEDHLGYVAELEGYHHKIEAGYFNQMRGVAMLLGYHDLLEPEIVIDEIESTFKRLVKL